MKKNLFLVALFFSFSFALFAQGVYPVQKAMEEIKSSAALNELSDEDVSDILVNTNYYNPRTQAYYGYFNQSIDGIPIKNAIAIVVIDKNGKTITNSNTFLSNAKSRIVNGKNNIDIEKALVKASEQLGIQNPKVVPSAERRQGAELVFEKSNISNSPILAKKHYIIEDGKLHLAYEFSIDMKNSPDYWEYTVDATSGEFIKKDNLTTYCNHTAGQFGKAENCEHEHSTRINASLSMAGESYNIFPLPTESPLHGSRTIVTDPAIPASSPFGWHDDDGDGIADYSYTRGNNVYAFSDFDDDDASDGDDPDGGAALNFDFPLDFNLEPTSNKDASTTNLFYTVNMMHDINYLHGFDEVSGNFQSMNFSGDGTGGDEVHAQSFDGFQLHLDGQDLDANGNPTKINNANFSTPQEGFSGRMQMYLWDRATSGIYISQPSLLEGYITEYGTAQFGSLIPESFESPIEGKIALARDASPGSETQSCKDIVNTDEISGNFAMIDRGLCDFSLKAYNAEQAGAIAVLICNVSGVNGGDGDETLTMAAGELADQVHIPALFLKKSDCDKIKISINSGVDVTMRLHEIESSGPAFTDGSLDNGVIAHEFAHGISNRLVSGPLSVSCLTNQEQMGEGWSDFYALAVTAEEGDQGSDVRGIGNFADGKNVDGRGIRRFPYSTDMNICPLTYDDIKTGSIPHGVGEIWAATLWDLYWKFVDQYGFDADFTNVDSGNARAIELVTEALKHTVCQPGYLSGRTGILQADQLLYGGEHECMIWEVFARRGMGYGASQGETDNVQDGIESYLTKPSCLNSFQIVQIDAEGGKLSQAGEEVELTVNASNYTNETKDNLIVKVNLPDGLEYVDGSAIITYGFNENDNPENFIADKDKSSTKNGKNRGSFIEFEIGTLENEKSANIVFKVVSDPDRKSPSFFFNNFEDENLEGWDVTNEEGLIYYWTSSDAYAHSGILSQSIYYEADVEMDASLYTPSIKLVGTNPVLRFYHLIESEQGADGGFIMVSTDGGNSYAKAPNKFLRNGYNSDIQYTTFAIPELRGFSGSTQGQFIDSYLDLSDYAGQDVNIRFRFGSDDNTAPAVALPGWYVDDVQLIDMVSYPLSACLIDGSNELCTDLDAILIDSDSSVGTNDLGSRFELEVYPNPADDYVSIALQSTISEIVTIKILSMDGKLVTSNQMKINTNKSIKSLDLSGISAGIYTLVIESNGAVRTEKLVVY